MAPGAAPTRPKRNRKPRKVIGTKRAPLPANAQVYKRPLLRPAIPPPYTSASTPKVVYVSTKTPFLSAVKRVEKLLRLSEKRAVQSAAAHIKKNRRRRGPASREGEDDIDGIARHMEETKKGAAKKEVSRDMEGEDEGVVEEVAIKGTGKAIQKVSELGLWFQQREDFAVRIATGSAGAVDDIEINEEDGKADDSTPANTDEAQAGGRRAQADYNVAQMEDAGDVDEQEVDKEAEAVPETRIRYTSVLEVYVRLR